MSTAGLRPAKPSGSSRSASLSLWLSSLCPSVCSSVSAAMLFSCFLGLSLRRGFWPQNSITAMAVILCSLCAERSSLCLLRL